MRLPLSFAALVAGLAQTQAQYLINELSFGYGSRYGFSLEPRSDKDAR
jgi:mannose-binding lectin 1